MLVHLVLVLVFTARVCTFAPSMWSCSCLEDGGTLCPPEAALDAHQLLFYDIRPPFTVLKRCYILLDFERVAVLRYLYYILGDLL